MQSGRRPFKPVKLSPTVAFKLTILETGTVCHLYISYRHHRTGLRQSPTPPCHHHSPSSSDRLHHRLLPVARRPLAPARPPAPCAQGRGQEWAFRADPESCTIVILSSSSSSPIIVLSSSRPSSRHRRRRRPVIVPSPSSCPRLILRLLLLHHHSQTI